MKRIGVIADLHCGHRAGLTPPEWQWHPVSTREENAAKRNKWAKLQSALWYNYRKILREVRDVGKLDILFVVGDMVDGKGYLSGGTELITSDRIEQVAMAQMCIDALRKTCGKKGMKIVGVYGTPYHTGRLEDWENQVAKDAKFDKIGAHEWVDVEGVIFDIKHKVSTSVIPHGRFTGPARSALWNEIWSLYKMQPRADILLRAHAHYHVDCGDTRKRVMVCPALQGMGSKHGARQCEGYVDWGLVVFEVNRGSFDWKSYVVEIAEQRAEALVL
jgi:hypothetical protein